MEAISYYKFKELHFATVDDSGYRLGQHFINVFIKRCDNSADYDWLFNSDDDSRVNDYLEGFIYGNQWDINELQIVRPLYK